MKRLLVIVALATIAVAAAPGPAAAGGVKVQLIRNFPTVLAVRKPTSPDFPMASLMRADCKWLYRVTEPDGSSIETQKCILSDEPVMIPDFQGTPPVHRVKYGGGECLWSSDFWFVRTGADVKASSYRVLVTPRGEAFVTSTYPRRPLSCPDPA